MTSTIEVRVRQEDDEMVNATPAFEVEWSQLEAARKAFQEWGTTVVSEDGDAYSEAYGTLCVEPGPKGKVWFDVMLSNG